MGIFKALKWEDLRTLFPQGHKHNNKDAAGDLLWWAAYAQAADMADGVRELTTKDWAQFLLDGYPSMECDDVVQFANVLVEDRLEDEDDEAEAKRHVLNTIREFYKLPIDMGTY